jgi:TatD-related deoxyribonuclease
MEKFPILDDHLHLQPEGMNVEAIKKFQKAGGTHAILAHMPYKGTKIKTGKDFMAQYEITLGLAERCNKETNVKVFTVLGPYPGHLAWSWDELGEEKTVEAMIEGMDIAASLVKEGKAIAIGEIGRPHFPVSEAIWARSNQVMRHGMKLAKEIGCPVVLHTESATPDVWRELAGMADEVGLPREKVVKHYSGPAILETENFGLFPSVLASRKNIEEAAKKGSRFFMETDFLDDPKRPGAVLAADTVPKRTMAMLQSGVFNDETVARIHGDWPGKIYKINTG